MKILFCGVSFTDVNRYIQPLLMQDQCFACPGDDVDQYIKEVDILVTLGCPVSEALMKQGTFGFIQQFGVGLEKIDMGAANRHGIWVARAPSTETGNADSVAENAIMLMLMLSRRYPQSRQMFKEGRIGVPIGQALAWKKACIIGLGGLGSALAQRLHDLKMEVTGVHEYPERGTPQGVKKLFGLNDIHQAVSDADYVILCLNYTSRRYHLIDKPEIQAMKQGAFLINVARGGLLNEGALLEALENNQLAGAGLDVFWEEPVDPLHPMFDQNVIATPHIAGATDINIKGTTKIVVENVKRYARGEKPLFVANNPINLRHTIGK